MALVKNYVQVKKRFGFKSPDKISALFFLSFCVLLPNGRWGSAGELSVFQTKWNLAAALLLVGWIFTNSPTSPSKMKLKSSPSHRLVKFILTINKGFSEGYKSVTKETWQAVIGTLWSLCKFLPFFSPSCASWVATASKQQEVCCNALDVLNAAHSLTLKLLVNCRPAPLLFQVKKRLHDTP